MRLTLPQDVLVGFVEPDSSTRRQLEEIFDFRRRAIEEIFPAR